MTSKHSMVAKTVVNFMWRSQVFEIGRAKPKKKKKYFTINNDSLFYGYSNYLINEIII